MILNILMILIGIYISLYSFFEIRVWSSLYFDRDYLCIEKFRKATKTTDLVSCMHNLTSFIFGFTMIVAGMKRWIPESNSRLAYIFLIVCFALLVLDVLVVEVATRARGLKQVCEAIKTQWKTQKHVTPENNHEVNAYRGCVRVTQKYPKHIMAMGVGMVFMLLFFI